jgi:hypothetical protein
MGRKSEFTPEQRTQLVLKLLSKEEPYDVQNMPN